jgi:hypothetical protein
MFQEHRIGRWRRATVIAIVLNSVWSLTTFSGYAAHAEPSDLSNATVCATQCSKDLCLPGDWPGRSIEQCKGMCESRCIAQFTHHTALFPRYQVLTVVYAPPGCTSAASDKCGTTSTVDYQSGSSTGTKTSLQESFKVGTLVSVGATLPISYNGQPIGKLSGGPSDEFSTTSTDSMFETFTKSDNFDLKIPANGDGVNHKQDQIIILLNPAIYLSNFDGKITWSTGYAGNAPQIYILCGAWLANPASMPRNVADELSRRGFISADYQTILTQDPFVNGSTAIDPARYVATKLTFPYEPPLMESDCNAGVCTCASLSRSVRNEYQREVVHAYQTQHSESFSGGIDLSIFGLKEANILTWTNTASMTNTTATSNSAMAVVSCPSVSYSGPTLMAVYWDTLYGSFLFAPVEPGAKTALLQSGRVKDASGKPVVKREVVLAFGGTTLRTFTDHNGDYKFYDLSGIGAKFRQEHGKISLGAAQMDITVGTMAPSVIHLK